MRSAGLAAAAAGSAGGGKSLEVANEVGSADVLLENEVAMENMKLRGKGEKAMISIYFFKLQKYYKIPQNSHFKDQRNFFNTSNICLNISS